MTDPIHASCVAIGGRGVLILGGSGTGKSDLALRLIDRGARLVSDDYTHVENEGGVLIAHAPERIAGLIEVRGLGLLPIEAVGRTRLALVVEAGAPERMPEPETWAMHGIVLPRIRLSLLEPSAPIKVELALGQLA